MPKVLPIVPSTKDLNVLTSKILEPKKMCTSLNLLPIILEFLKIFYILEGVASVTMSKSFGVLPTNKSLMAPPTK